jgi:glutamine synthetase
MATVTTDIENFIHAPGRDQKVAEVREKINELGIEYIYYQFVSVTGRVVGKGAPAAQWERMTEKGFQLVYGSTANLFMDRFGDYIGYGPHEWELLGIPEPETFVQLPWDKRIARVFCTIFRGREHPENPGVYLTSDCRGNLRRIHEEFQQDHDGLHLRAGTEPEMMWLKKDENGKPAGGYSKPFCYHIDQFESLRPVFMKVIEYASQMGLDVIQGDHEDAPGQLELNFSYDEVLRNADRLTTFRQICAQVAREFDLIACFMSKPFMEVSASGCHTNISLWRGGETVVNSLGNETLPGMEGSFTYAEGGENVFLPEGDNPREPGTIGKQALGGLLEHQPGITIFGIQNVNSYKRLLEPGFWAPVYANWGYQNRTAGIRNSAPGRFEYKAVDSANNPYIMGAGLLKAMDDGIKRNLSLGEPEQRNIYDLTQEDRDRYTKLPMSLGEGIEALERDEVAKSALPGEMYRVLMHYKRDEWERYLATVTDWDLENYIDCLP